MATYPQTSCHAELCPSSRASGLQCYPPLLPASRASRLEFSRRGQVLGPPYLATPNTVPGTDSSSINICCLSASCPSPNRPLFSPLGLSLSCTLLSISSLVSRRHGVGIDGTQCGTRKRKVTHPRLPGEGGQRERRLL